MKRHQASETLKQFVEAVDRFERAVKDGDAALPPRASVGDDRAREEWLCIVTFLAMASGAVVWLWLLLHSR